MPEGELVESEASEACKGEPCLKLRLNSRLFRSGTTVGAGPAASKVACLFDSSFLLALRTRWQEHLKSLRDGKFKVIAQGVMAHAKKFMDTRSENVLLRDLFELAERAAVRAGCWSDAEATVEAGKILTVVALALHKDEDCPMTCVERVIVWTFDGASYAGQDKVLAPP